MKQVIQHLGSGLTEVLDVPCPVVRAHHLLIRTEVSLISPGTERMLVQFGKANYLEKARQQPDKVRQVLDKMKTDGVIPTLEAVRGKLDKPLPLGYCNVGTVVAAGPGVSGFGVGDRVVSNGPHAGMVSVPANLCALIPDGVTSESAAFTVMGAIALQGLRLANPALGETFAVTGLGVIGLAAVQLLRANGCRVIGIDLSPGRTELARDFGAEPLLARDGLAVVTNAMAMTGGRGVDGVLIAAATNSNEPVSQAARMSRRRGRIVLVGVAGLDLVRDEFYKKEISFQVSCSYGPGRYDPRYEEGGQDYPVDFVRWTAQRNFEAVLGLMRDKKLDFAPFITHRYEIDEAAKAYAVIDSPAPCLGIILRYPASPSAEARMVAAAAPQAGPRIAGPRAAAKAVAGVIGAGSYASQIIIPALVKTGASLAVVASQGGLTAAHAARKYGFRQAASDVNEVIANKDINAVFIATRHDSHAGLVSAAIEAGKAVFVEKPLAITQAQIDQIEAAHSKARLGGCEPFVMVGFNRRFAPHVVKIREMLTAVKGPKAFIFTANAGAIPTSHWTQDAGTGGGRIIGEGCHFIDLLRFLADEPIASFAGAAIPGEPVESASFTLSFASGSIATVHYLANGNKGYPKERLQVFAGGRVLDLNNFIELRGWGCSGFSKMSLWRQDKGNEGAVRAFIEAVENGAPSPVPWSDVVEVSRKTIEISEALARRTE